MLKIGTYVSYRTEGVCVISDIRTEAFGPVGGSEEYYILTPLKDRNSVLYVPVNNSALTEKMQPLLSAEEISALAEELRDRRLVWRSESRARNYEFKEIVNTGDRRSLMVLVNTIVSQREKLMSSGKRLTGGDENVLKRALGMLYDEFSVTVELADEGMLISALRGEISLQPKK